MSQPSTPSDEAEDNVKLIHVVQKTIATTARSTLDLLSLSFPFSQVALLDPSEFVKAASQRRITMWGRRDLDVSGLQELHQHGVLVPFYWVSVADRPAGVPIDVAESLTAKHVRSTTVRELYSAAADGRLVDPMTEPFAPWPTEVTWPSVESGYLYSYHQLLALEHARSVVASLRPRFLADHRRESFLPQDDLPNEHAREGLASWRSLAITLSALDTRAWPAITHWVKHSTKVWRASNLAQAPEDLLAWLGISVDQLRKQSEQLRIDASFRDDIGDFMTS